LRSYLKTNVEFLLSLGDLYHALYGKVVVA
jgi:hypothetical protein